MKKPIRRRTNHQTRSVETKLVEALRFGKPCSFSVEEARRVMHLYSAAQVIADGQKPGSCSSEGERDELLAALEEMRSW